MVKCTAEMTRCVCIRVRGEGGKFPVLPKDDGLVGRLTSWLYENEIRPAVVGGCSGPGMYEGFFWPEDAPRVVAWLEEENVGTIEVIKAIEPE